MPTVMDDLSAASSLQVKLKPKPDQRKVTNIQMVICNVKYRQLVVYKLQHARAASVWSFKIGTLLRMCLV